MCSPAPAKPPRAHKRAYIKKKRKTARTNGKVQVRNGVFLAHRRDAGRAERPAPSARNEWPGSQQAKAPIKTELQYSVNHAKFVATLVKPLFNKATSCELFSKLWQD